MKVIKTFVVELDNEGKCELPIPAMSKVLGVRAKGWTIHLTAIVDPSETEPAPKTVRAFQVGARFTFDDPHRLNYVGSYILPDESENHLFIDKSK